MTPSEFEKRMDGVGGDFGLCPKPLTDRDAVDILIDHFLGEDWHVVMSMGREQITTAAVYDIISRNQKFKDRIKNWIKR